ncbi:FAD-binding oxidoreductase [Streptomyces armeniacus]|uniref:FAD-binding oxidoreductase n=1 Tax=Streptomyces armeniacus TaxID=83291 RepID=A0A345XJV2_9ACTN|nr:FAD-binding oxidoreductase [Streptomyces armeniacus]AXK31918.1 FAD-binding oxidoreductase [Streptomyces armeniacus]
MNRTGETGEFLIVGGGIAGASAGWHLARAGHRVTLLEAERTPGVHSTGRSSALFSEYFGNTAVRALTRASRDFYAAPPPGFTDVALLAPRGVLALETPGTEAGFEEARESGADAPEPAVEVDAVRALELCPALRPDAFRRALYKPGARDIDVDAAHQGFLRGLRAAGGTVVTGARVVALARRGGRWHATTAGPGPARREGPEAAREFTAEAVVNAAGAWADQVAGLAGARPAGLVPRRRTAVLAAVPPPGNGQAHGPGTGHRPGYAAADVARWPMVTDVADTFYAKPESGALLLSPADATPVPPGDVRPDDLDVALAVERFEAVTTLKFHGLRARWAGLRTSPPDDTPVIGPDPGVPGFSWLAGLGGYGIQTAPAAGALLAVLVTGGEPPPALTALAPRTPLPGAAELPPHCPTQTPVESSEICRKRPGSSPAAESTTARTGRWPPSSRSRRT